MSTFDDVDSAIPMTVLPYLATPAQVAAVLQTTVDSLAQDRYRRRGLPFVKIGGRVRYVRGDVIAAIATPSEGGAE